MFLNPSNMMTPIHFQHLDITFHQGIGVVIHRGGLNIGMMIGQIQSFHLKLFSTVKIDGLIMKHFAGRMGIHLTNNNIPPSRLIHNHHIVISSAPEGHPFRRIRTISPVPPPPALTEHTLLLQISQQVLGISPKIFPLFKGKLKGCTFEVISKNVEILGVEISRFRGSGKKVIRVTHQVLICGVCRPHKKSQ